MRVPAGTSLEVIPRLNHEIVAAAHAKAYADLLTQIGGEVIAGSPAEFGHLISTEAERWAQVAALAKVRE